MREKDIHRTSIGGQAIIEGIMMRGPDKQSIVIRKPDGELSVKEEPVKAASKIPVIRGVVNFGRSMVDGVKALMYSSEFMPEDEQEEPSKLDKWIEEKFEWEKAQKIIIGLAVVLAVGLMVGLFILLPTALAGLVDVLGMPQFMRSLSEAVLRVAIFVLYLVLVSKSKDIRRVFEYHGAEHKSIHCYEKGLPLTVENVREQPRQHPRCGTSFLFVVVIVSTLLFSFVSWQNIWIRLALRILLLPVVVAISYEINRWVGRHDNTLSAILSAPGKAMQNLTTREPDDSMIEVGIRAMEMVIPEDKGTDEW